MRAKHFCLALLLFYINSISAQDIHFTQFFTNPLILNPAQTGNFDGNYRIGFNFKAQWPWAITGTVYNYHTETPYVDFSFGEKKIKTGWMGIGFNFLNDEAGDGGLTYRRFSISYAYHQTFDREHRYILSVGVVGSYIIRSVNSNFYFNDQWVDDVGFNTALNPNEPIQRFSYSTFDLGAGLNFNAQVSDRVKLDAGFSMLHINRPSGSFYNENEHIGYRYQASAGFQYNLGRRITLNVNGYYGNEKTAEEGIAGAMVGYGFFNSKSSTPSNVLYFGMYYRVKDALAPLAGYQYKKTRLLLNYDVPLSKLVSASKGNGGPELSIVHVGGWEREFNNKKVYCPKF